MSLSASFRRRHAIVPAGVWIVGVGVVSVVAGGRTPWVVRLAASPDRIAEGKVWFLVTSAFLVDHPVVLSLVAFAALAGLSWFVCGPRGFWVSAMLGQIAATLIVYAFIGAVRGVVPDGFGRSLSSPDFGVSTVSAAWLGSIACVGWRRRGRTQTGKAAIAVSCLAVGLFAYSVRPDVTVLSSEHLVAFCLGVGAVSPEPWAAIRARVARLRLRPLAQGLVALGLAGLLAPAAFSDLRQQIAIHLDPTASRCARSWYGLGARTTLAPPGSPVAASVSTTHLEVARGFAASARPPVYARYCRFVVEGRSGAAIVLGLWRGGRLTQWRDRFGTWPLDARRNAVLTRTGRIHLLRDPHRITLTS